MSFLGFNFDTQFISIANTNEVPCQRARLEHQAPMEVMPVQRMGHIRNAICALSSELASFEANEQGFASLVAKQAEQITCQTPVPEICFEKNVKKTKKLQKFFRFWRRKGHTRGVVK